MTTMFSPQASWIWLLDRNFNEGGRRVFFRKSFEVAEIPGSAPLRITADSRYMLYVNGKFVNYGSERSGYNGSWPADTVDIAPFLQTGKNVLAVRVIHLTPDIFCQPAALLGGLLFELPSLGLFSDNSVKVFEPQGFGRRTFKTSFQYVWQEHADLNLIPHNWQSTNFDDSAWKNADYCRHSETEPYGRIVPRETPLFSCRLIEPVLTMQSAWQGKDAPDAADEPVALYCRENPRWEPAANGTVRAELYDFRRTRPGTILLEYSGASGSEWVDLIFTESALPDGKPFVRAPEDAGQVATAARVKLAPGSGSHELDMPVGMRFTIAVIRGGKGVNIRIFLRDLSYPWHFTGEFHASEKLLNDLYTMAVNTQKACAADTYTDCPWREQVQWWGDARIQAINTFALSTDTTLL